jgi:DNA-binding response OmpR family regulator
MKILYVEDTLLDLCLVERIARMGNHEVINYAFAERALRYFERDQPDLVLIDIRLEGEMSGIELIQRLRSARHQQPTVVITAITTDEMRERCMLVGANEYFTKPLPVRDMLRIIQQHEKTLADATNETPPERTIEPSNAKPEEKPKVALRKTPAREAEDSAPDRPARDLPKSHPNTNEQQSNHAAATKSAV